MAQSQQAGFVQSIGGGNAEFATHTHATAAGLWQPVEPTASPGSRPLISQSDVNQDCPTIHGLDAQRQRTSSALGQQPVQQRHTSPEANRDSRQAADLQSDVLQTFVTSSRDAVGLLFRAAEQNDSDSSDEQSGLDNARQENMLGSVYSMPSPALASNETLSLWEKHRFVRQGWFTPREAVSYIEL